VTAEGGGEAKVPFYRAEAGFALSVIALLAAVFWMLRAQDAIGIVLVVVLVAAVLYRVVSRRVYGRALRENLQFIVLSAGFVAFYGTLVGWNLASLVPVWTTILIYAVFALGLNLQFGYAGIINFGHVAFMAIGAYGTVILTLQWVPHVDALREPGISWLVVAGAVLVAALILGVLGSVLLEWHVKAPPGSGARRRAVLLGGGVGAVLGAVLVLIVVPVPLTPMWATAFLIAGALMVGILAAVVAGLVLGLPTLRLRADYLAIVTIGAAEILRRVLRNEAWLTRGHHGIPQFPRPFTAAAGEWPWLAALSRFLDVRPYTLLLFLMSLTALLLVLALLTILVNSPYGRVLRAIREDEEVPRALGKNVFRFKIQALALGGAMAALAGGLLSWRTGAISPNAFIPLFTFWAWIIIMLGGVGSNKGVILGAIILFTFFDSTRFLPAGFDALRNVIIGVLLIVLMLFRPEGLLGRREEMVLGR
jgi:neutral amino acid transport system permease protein